MTEFVLWGKPPGHDDTYGKALLMTGLTSRAAAEKAQAVLANDHGVKNIYIQRLDGVRPEFGRASLAGGAE